MLNQPLIDQLHALHLHGMAASFEQQSACPDLAHQPFENRLGLMIEQERLTRASARLAQRLRWAKLPQPACLEDLDTRTARGIDPAQLAALVDLGWLRQHLNLLITGPTGVGKSYIASALAHAACRADFSVRCYRLPRLVEELVRHAAQHKRSAFYRQLARVDLIVIDDFGLAPLAPDAVRDLLEILDDRYDRRSTLITSQLPVDQWHVYLGDRTVADAILDRLVHNSYRLVLKGDSMRKRRPPARALIDDAYTVDDSLKTVSHPAGMDRNGGPASPGIPGRHGRNPQPALPHWCRALGSISPDTTGCSHRTTAGGPR